MSPSLTAANAIPQAVSKPKAPIRLKPQGKKVKPLQIIALAAIALLCLSGLYRAMHQAPTQKMVQVVAAGRDLLPGTEIGFTSLRFIPVPREYVTRDMVFSLNGIVNHETRTYLPAR